MTFFRFTFWAIAASKSILGLGVILTTIGLIGCDRRKAVANIGGPRNDQGIAEQDLKLDSIPSDVGHLDRQRIDKSSFYPNSGVVCTNPSECHASDDCLPVNTTNGRGMCLSKCTSAGKICQTSNPAAQYSVCMIEASDGTFYCGWVCSYGGKTYSCPNTNQYNCTAPDPKQPTVKLCIPK